MVPYVWPPSARADCEPPQLCVFFLLLRVTFAQNLTCADTAPSIILRPSATLVAPTFPPRRGIETYATPTVSLPAPTEFSPSSTVLIAAVIPVTDTSVLPLATGALPAAVYRGIFKEGARVAGMKQVPAVVVADLVASAMALVSSSEIRSLSSRATADGASQTRRLRWWRPPFLSVLSSLVRRLLHFEILY